MEAKTKNPAKVRAGEARAAALTSEQRKSIARNAAQTRWDPAVPDVLCGSPDRPIEIGNAKLQCYVLTDGTRVLSQGDFLEVLGRHRKANVRAEGGEERIPAILQGKAINSFISQEILEKSAPIRFRLQNGGRANGYRAEMLPEVCEIYLKAREAGALPKNQLHVAVQAEILMRALAHVGIIALVDEITGYQELRDREDLHRLLAKYLSEERLRWAKMFPDEFYRQLYRLKGWVYPQGVQRTPLVGHITNKLIYEKLPPGALEQLRERNPIRKETSRRKWKHFQFLSEDIGQPDLRDHLLQVVAIMRGSVTWEGFIRTFKRAFPDPNQQEDLELE